MPEGLDVGTRGGDLWYLECLALVGDVVYREDPGGGRVHTARWTEQDYGGAGGRQQARGWRIDVPFRMDATRVWDTIDVGRALSHNLERTRRSAERAGGSHRGARGICAGAGRARARVRGGG